jgi:succinate dehydrogenase/fumarate reductase-like Fe-S protein
MTKFHIFRFDPKADAAPRYQDYEVPEEKGRSEEHTSELQSH